MTDDVIQTIDFCTHIRKRPGMYLGCPSVERLYFFVEGYRTAGGDVGKFDGFGDFVRKRFKTTYNGPWVSLIQFHAEGEANQWSLFERIWEEYEQAGLRKTKKRAAKPGVSKEDGGGHPAGGVSV